MWGVKVHEILLRGSVFFAQPGIKTFLNRLYSGFDYQLSIVDRANLVFDSCSLDSSLTYSCLLNSGLLASCLLDFGPLRVADLRVAGLRVAGLWLAGLWVVGFRVEGSIHFLIFGLWFPTRCTCCLDSGFLDHCFLDSGLLDSCLLDFSLLRVADLRVAGLWVAGLRVAVFWVARFRVASFPHVFFFKRRART